MQIADIKSKRTVLVGTYRTEKAQQDWILGLNPVRHEILYNVRYNQDIFAARDGGITSLSKPDFVLLYDYHDLKKTGHLFECLSQSIVNEDEMRFMQYPDPNGSYVVYRLGEEVNSTFIDIEAIINEQIAREPNHIEGAPFLISIEDVRRFVKPEDIIRFSVTCDKKKVVRFIDLFAGIGGIRCGLEQAIRDRGFEPVCVFTSEIKPYAVRVLHDNHPAETITGDITKVETQDIPDFDILCAGFPCQAFSSAGKRKGFADTRGTMFFEVERILKDKQPLGFILENVEGLVNHDGGRTLQVIVDHLKALNYHFSYRVLNSRFFGVPQERKRIYIVGTRNDAPNLDNFPVVQSTLADVLEDGLPTEHSQFIDTLLAHYAVEDLYGKSIKDKRGGDTNIHSWDLGLKGEISKEERELLESLMRERRKKQWAEEIGIDWMDGMPLTTAQIQTFYHHPDLQQMLDHLSDLGYVKYEHPKKLIKTVDSRGNQSTYREPDPTKPRGYNIVAGKLSFPISKVLSPNEVAPTLVAMDMQKLYVGDNGGLRKLSLREGLRLCGYPDNIVFNVSESEGFDLLGNTVVVPVIKAVAGRLLETLNY
jgi:DNA (cytosine-5)-methyltransferase 1